MPVMRTLTVTSDGTIPGTRILEGEFFEFDDLQITASSEGLQAAAKLLKTRQSENVISAGNGLHSFDLNDYVDMMPYTPFKVKALTVQLEYDLEAWQRNHAETIRVAESIATRPETFSPFEQDDILAGLMSAFGVDAERALRLVRIAEQKTSEDAGDGDNEFDPFVALDGMGAPPDRAAL